MIPAEIIEVSLIIGFCALWLVQKGKNAKLRHDVKVLEEKNRQLELANATLSGALTSEK